MSIVARNAVTLAVLVQAAIIDLTPPRGQFMADFTDRAMLAWSALVMLAEHDGVVHRRDIMAAAGAFALSRDEAIVLAHMLRDTVLEAQS